MRAEDDDRIDLALSVVAFPVTALPAAVIAVASITPAAGAISRFFETGPWGVIFDRMTWLPWCSVYAVPRCLYVHLTGESELLPIDALPPTPSGSKRIVHISDTHGKHSLLRLPSRSRTRLTLASW